MKLRLLHITSVVMICLTLASCGIPKPTQNPDEIIGNASAPATGTASVAEASYGKATCTYYSSTGEIGTFQGYTKQGKSKSFSTPETMYHESDGMVTVNQYTRPNVVSINFTEIPDNAFALVDFLETSLKLNITGTENISETEAIFNVTTTVNDIDLQGFLGVSVINNETLFTELAVYSEDASDEMKSTFKDICMTGFSSKIFTQTSETTSKENPNESVDTMYITMPGIDYDIITPGKTIVVPNSLGGSDIWVNKDTCISIQRVNTGHVDLSITEYNLGLEDYQKLLVPNSTDVEDLKVVNQPAKNPSYTNGFWTDYSVSYKIDGKPEYVTYSVIADEEGFTVVTIHSSRILTDKVKKLYTFIQSDVRKTNGQYKTIPAAVASNAPESGAILPVYVTKDAMTSLRNVSSEFMLEKFGESNVSGAFMNKQLYYKDNFVKVLLPFTSSMYAPAGTTDTASSSYVPYVITTPEQTETSKINLMYTMISDSSEVTLVKDEQLTDIQLYGFESVAETMLDDFTNQMQDNNILFSTDSENITSNTYQREFTYRFNDDVTNKQYSRHGAMFIKHIDSDNYKEGSEIYFVAILDWGTGAKPDKLKLFQQAFESTVKQLP